MMNNDDSYPVLQEFPLESNFLELIPARAQRGLSTFDLEFTCLDADGSYIAIGSNVGIVYLINREISYVHKLKDNDHKNIISSVKVLISLECLIAVGYKDGAVLVYKVPFTEKEELEKFTVEGLHSSSITALEWAMNGMKFFSGDENGIVVCTEIDHLEHQSRSRILMNEKSKIVQLSYSHLNLAVSTLFRSLIYSLKTNATIQIGQKERKCFGPFGAIIFEDDQNCSIFASRPGQRLWKSDICGIIQETMIFKTVLSQSHPSIQVLAKLNENICFTDFQFERLARYDSYILIWCDSYITLVDPNQKLIIGISPKLDPIIDVATCKKEIFILRGVRHIMRISSEPDAFSSMKAAAEEPSLLEEILVPFKGLSTYVKERSDSMSVQSERESNLTIFDWLKKKRSASSPADICDDVISHENAETTSSETEHLPAIVNLSSDDYIPVKIDELSTTVIDAPELLTKDFSKGNESEDIVYKVKKKHKKHKKVQFAIDAAPKRERSNYKSSADSNKISSNEAKKIVDSNKVLENNETNSQSVISKVPNELDINSASLGPIVNNSKNINTDSNEAITLNNDHAENKISEKSDVDTDKLLENVLSAYSNFKHQDLLLENSINTLNISETEVNELVCPCNPSKINLESHKEDCSHIEACDNLTQVDNETYKTANKNSQESQVTDADEVYSSLPTIKLEMKETPSSEDSMESLSLEDSSTSSLENKGNDPPKYGVDWVEYKAPELLLDISVSNAHIFCVDVRNQLYFSTHPQLGSLHWIELDQPAEKVAVSDSETVVWVLYKGTVYAACHRALSLWENTEWISIARDVVSIAVDDDCGWYARSNGELVTQQNLCGTKPSNYPETVPCNSPALQVAVKGGVLWVLTIGGSLLTKMVDRKHSKSLWKEIVLKDIPGIDSIFLGSKKTGWIIDSNSMIRFIIGVTPETPEGTGEPWLVEASSYLFRPTTQLEQVVRRALNTEALTNLIRGKQHLCLSTSDMGVWFCKTYDNLLYSNQKSIIGHIWESVIPPNTAAAIKWSLIAADGINNSEGALWCVSSAGELFCYCIKSQNLFPVELPSSSGVRCLQSKYQSVWLLSEEGNVYIRRGITLSCLQGIWWQTLDLLQFGSQQITHISCSSFVSWACTAEGEVFMRLGTLNPSSSKLNQAWLSIGTDITDTASPVGKLSAIGKHFPLPIIPIHFSEVFSKVYVGPQGYPVWAIDSKQNVHVREGVTTNLPIGNKWTSIPDLHAKELCISNNAVWLLKASGKIYRRFGVTEKNPCGDYWKQMPGKLDYLSATEDDDIWGIQNGSMFCHYSFVLYSTQGRKSTERMISEEDWEDIMADDFDHD